MASADEETNPLGPALPLLVAAMDLGGRAASAGDNAGAYNLFGCAARLARKVRGLGEVADFRLERALEEAEESRSDAPASTEVLRRAFESLLPDELLTTPLPDEPLAATQRLIEAAISIGAPAYNTGDHQGCFDVYSCTARMILATQTGPDAAQERLRKALDECAALDDPNRQAWAMRHGFDAVLAMGATGAAVAPREVLRLLAMAIQIGAPSFNLGDARGCYEVYACTARLLVNSAAVADEVKERLRTALAEASVVPDVSRQAWIMRYAFDALLGAKADAGGGEDEEGRDEDTSA